MSGEAIGSQLLGVIDIGSNSVRYVVFETYGASFTPTYNEKLLAGLGRDLRMNGRLNPQGKETTLAALRRFALLARVQGVGQLLVAATAAMREASDAPEFIDQIYRETGLKIEPLSGEEEARLAANGLLAGDVRASGIAADLGGASLELISVGGGTANAGISFPLGPFAMYKGDFDPEKLRVAIKAKLAAAAGIANPGQPLYLIGGAWRNLSLIHQKRTEYPLRVAYNYALEPDEAHGLGQWAAYEGVEELLSWPSVSARRAETLPYAGLMMTILCEQFSPSSVIIAAGGLREGMVYDTLSRQQQARNALFDSCDHLADGAQQAVNFGVPLYEFLNPVSEYLPAGFADANDDRLRRAACHLVGIGKGMHPSYRAAHIFETVLYAPLPDLTHKERAYLALVLFASYTAKSKTPNDAALNHHLSEKEQRAARSYGEAMRFGVVLAGRSYAALEQCTLSADHGALSLHCRAGYEDLLTSRVHYRLERLAAAAGLGLSA